MTQERNRKLMALTTLSVRSGILQEDYHDIKQWAATVGPDFDMWLLSEKAIERIDSIYSKFFEE